MRGKPYHIYIYEGARLEGHDSNTEWHGDLFTRALRALQARIFIIVESSLLALDCTIAGIATGLSTFYG